MTTPKTHAKSAASDPRRADVTDGTYTPEQVAVRDFARKLAAELHDAASNAGPDEEDENEAHRMAAYIQSDTLIKVARAVEAAAGLES